MNARPRIREVACTRVTLTPVFAEVRGVVRGSGPGMLAARLHGPRSRHAETVEVGYPVRFESPSDAGEWQAAFGVRVPEPNLWDWQTPFLYQLAVTLSGDRDPERAALLMGLRRFTLGPDGFRCNGRGISLAAAGSGTPAEVRAAGDNALLAAVAAADFWTEADQCGVLMLGMLPPRPSEWEGAVQARAGHASALAWVAPPGTVDAVETLAGAGWRLGLETEAVPSGAWPAGVGFLVIREGPRVRVVYRGRGMVAPTGR